MTSVDPVRSPAAAPLAGPAHAARADTSVVHDVGAHASGTVVEVALLRLDPGLPLPAYAHPGDAGADLAARVDVELAPGARASVPTGVAIALPDGYAAFVHPRSGLAARCGVTTLNAPGTIDAGYRGEIHVILLNTDQHESVRLRRGDRIAQLVVQRVERAVFVDVSELPESVRGAGGHGSTGGFAGYQARPGTSVGADAPEGEAP
ncbi:MAG TPA: dUTP diphosphatase [Actinomycetales bacterium]|nr:dUTP diphosphatase [Actinomycetales bacterium]